jgi:hypothetical protein
MALGQDQLKVEAFAAYAAQEALGDGVRVWVPKGCP